MGFSNPILGGEVLLRDAIQSNNYITTVSGWSINKDGTAEFVNVIIRGSITIGTGGNIITLDQATGMIEVFNAFNNLVAIMSPVSGFDPHGNIVFQGVGAYDNITTHTLAQLISGELVFALLDSTYSSTSGGALFSVNPHTATTQQPRLDLVSPSTNVAPDKATISVGGLSEDGTGQPFIRLFKSGSGDVTVLVDGALSYSVLGIQETWHAPTLAGSFANLGAGFGPVKYRKDTLGHVDITGAVQWTGGAAAAPQTIFTLPVGYRPNFTRSLVCQTMPAPGATPTLATIQIQTSGAVQLTSYPGAVPSPVTLENLHFDLTT